MYIDILFNVLYYVLSVLICICTINKDYYKQYMYTIELDPRTNIVLADLLIP